MRPLHDLDKIHHIQERVRTDPGSSLVFGVHCDGCGGVLEIYTLLIRQYLGLFCVDI